MAYTALNPLLVTIDATTAGVSATLVRPVLVVDAQAYVTTKSGGGASTLTVSSAGGAISSAIALGTDTDKVLGRTVSIDDANAAIASGATITATAAGGATVARANIICIDNS
tara:strand:+ start:96 stop:431 length:336 start_codon:yes stop_codon:yes gene_type:complete